MRRDELRFRRPPELQASLTPEDRGLSRDEVRLLVTTAQGNRHTRFGQLPALLRPGDLLVVNDSQTLPASLPATGPAGPFLLNVSTPYGRGLWLVEPRKAPDEPGPLPLEPGEEIAIAGQTAKIVAMYPGLPRLWFVRVRGDLRPLMAQYGQPIRYGYVARAYPLEAYQTLFARWPGSAEMPSAARPFTPAVVEALRARGVRLAALTLHAGVSSLEVEGSPVEAQPLYPEPFRVPEGTAQEVNQARRDGRRVIAVGTTVVRALETAWDGGAVRPMEGYTRAYLHPGRAVHVVDGLVTGLHDPVTTHLALLYALFDPRVIREAYAEAVDRGYLWHEFGDSHLILT